MSLRYWLVAVLMGVCVLSCGWKPRGDTTVLPDGSFGGIDVLAQDPTTGRAVKVELMAAPYVEEWPESRLHNRLVLPAGERALTFRVVRERTVEVVETIISVLPDTFAQVVVAVPVANQGPRLIPDEKCAIIKGTATAGRTGRRLPHVEIRAEGTSRTTYADALGNYRIAVPGRHHRLSAREEKRGASVDTVVAPGESAIVDIPVQAVLRSLLLNDLLQAAPVPWRAPLRDATTADSEIVRAVEDWLEQTDLEIEDTSNPRTFAAFELLGTSSRGKWVTVFGRARYSIPKSPYPTPDVSGVMPCIACLRRVSGRWVAAEPWYDERRVSPFVYREDWFPARYRKRIWSHGKSQADPLEARVRAKVAAWESRMAESLVGKP